MISPSKYKLIPKEVEAMQFRNNASYLVAIKEFVGDKGQLVYDPDAKASFLHLECLDGTRIANFSDWVIKKPDGFFSVVNTLGFKESYEEVAE